MSEQSPMEAEFDTVAAWTEQAVAELGHDHAIPAACRGSGAPADLAWLADGLALSGGDRFVDSGAGLGGPAAWLVENHTGDWWRAPLLADPMPHAAASARRMFGFPSVAAWGERMPLADDGVDAAWALGLLDTSDDQAGLLSELHRVLVRGGRLGLLVLVATVDPLPESPEGNNFPTRDELHAELDSAGFRIDAERDAATLPSAPDEWRERAERVDAIVRRDHGDDPAWREADAQQAALGRLLEERAVVTLLVRATAVLRRCSGVPAM